MCMPQIQFEVRDTLSCANWPFRVHFALQASLLCETLHLGRPVALCTFMAFWRQHFAANSDCNMQPVQTD